MFGVGTIVLVAVVCELGGQFLIYLISVVLALVALASGLSSWSFWREMNEEERGSLIGQMEGSRKGFMVYAGMLGSSLFLLAIVMQTLPVIFLNPCVPGGRI